MNPITLADVLTGRVPLYTHQLAPQQVGRLPQMQPMRPAQSGGTKTVIEEPTTDAVGAKAAAVKGRARPGRQSINAAVDGALDKAYAERRDPVAKALNARTVAPDSFARKGGQIKCGRH
jgi:hypothetical protein